MFVFDPRNHGDTAITLSLTKVPKSDERKPMSYLFFEFYALYVDAKQQTLYEFECQLLLRVYHDLIAVYSSMESSHLDC